MIVVPRLSYQSNLLSWCLYICFLFLWLFTYIISISAILLILVHSFYSWDQNHDGDHLVASFQQFIKSSHSQVIASAVEQAIKSCGEDHDLLCDEIIKIIWKHPLGKLTFQILFKFYSCITEHPTLMKAYPLNTKQVTAKKAKKATAKKIVPQTLRKWFRSLWTFLFVPKLFKEASLYW